MTNRTSRAQQVLDSLDAELAAVGEARGERLSWTAAECELREILAATIDRRERVIGFCERTRDRKLVVKLSAEIRQLDTAVGRLLKQIRTDVPQPESLTTIKARRAVNTRWDGVRAQA